MELKEKIYEYLCFNNLFGKESSKDIITRVSRDLHLDKKVVFDCLEKLSKERRIHASNSRVINLAPTFTGTFYRLDQNSGYVTIDNTLGSLNVKNEKIESGEKVTVAMINKNGVKQGVILSVDHKDKVVSGKVIRNINNDLVFIPTVKNGIREFVLDPKILKSLENKYCSIKIQSLDDSQKCATCVLDKVFGKIGDPISENESIAYEYGFEKNFNEKIINEVNALPNNVNYIPNNNRRDLRNKKFVTIDPATCKDMDDAVCIEKYKDGYKIMVAIADVSHYVKSGSEIDKEAYKRGTSCYLGDGVYPMLPEKLSNNICSLEEGKDRFVICVEMDMDTTGKIRNYDIYKAVINSKHKLSYEEAEDIHLHRNDMHNKYSDVQKQIDYMYEASDILEKLRKERGAISFDRREPTFKFDASKQNVIGVVDTSDVTSHAIIESFMILANECVATHMDKNNVPVLYRTHDKPDQNDLQAVIPILKELGYGNGYDISVNSLQKVLDKVRNTELEDYVNNLILRCYKKAKYQPNNIGHYGLGSEKYVHFTSPIRRYPDLVVHRQLSDILNKQHVHLNNRDLVEMGLHLTNQEKKADKAEEISDRLLSTIWAENHINETLNGYISAVREDGISVKNGLVEINIPCSELPGGSSSIFSVKGLKTKLVNKVTGEEFKVGDHIKFKIIEADRLKKSIKGTTNLNKQYKLNNRCM